MTRDGDLWRRGYEITGPRKEQLAEPSRDPFESDTLNSWILSTLIFVLCGHPESSVLRSLGDRRVGQRHRIRPDRSSRDPIVSPIQPRLLAADSSTTTGQRWALLDPWGSAYRGRSPSCSASAVGGSIFSIEKKRKPESGVFYRLPVSPDPAFCSLRTTSGGVSQTCPDLQQPQVAPCEKLF
ncbi:hypothetical protein VTN00DRAFT_1645 [Thermoascus crustaceus]|uniref:uncharacterized protein n=1 Tax=Thermoascus crustaceus TaxID=5088 RepID=UPI0037447DAB